MNGNASDVRYVTITLNHTENNLKQWEDNVTN